MTEPETRAKATIESQNVRFISILGLIGSWVTAAAFFFAAGQTQQASFTTLGVAGLLLGVALLVVYFINAGGYTRPAGIVALFSSWMAFSLYGLSLSGFSLILAALFALLAANVAIQIFRDQARYLAIGGVFLGSLCLLLLEFIDIGQSRMSVPANIQAIVVITGGMMGMILSIFTLRSLDLASVRNQFIIAFLIISLIPILITQVVQYSSIADTLRAEVERNLSENAETVIAETTSILETIETSLVNASKLQFFSEILENNQRGAEAAAQSLAALKLQNRYILSIAILDSTGKNILDTDQSQIGSNEGGTQYFLATALRRRAIISDIYYDPTINRSILYISAPIFSQNAEQNSDLDGVLRARIDGEVFQAVASEIEQRIGNEHTIIIIEQHEIILAHSRLPELRLRSLDLLRENILLSLQKNRQIPQGSADELSARLPEIHESLAILNNEAMFEAPLAPESETTSLVKATKFDNQPWTVIIGRSKVSVDAPITNQINSAIILVTVITLAIIISAATTARIFTEPLAELVKISEQVASGKLHLRIHSTRRDEIGTLTNAFNHANQTLEQTLASMDERIASRTRELQTLNDENGRRASQLQAITQVARSITSLQDLTELLPQVTERISQAFGFYHAGIFLIDKSGTFAVLQAASSPGGKRMLEKQHRLRVGQTGIVGYVTSAGVPRIALDVGEDASFFNNPELPTTRSEMALPLRIGDKIIGALDVQSEQPQAFDDADINTLSLLADQVSIAIQNARLFEETRQSLAETRALYSQSVSESWNTLTRPMLAGYRYANGNLEILTQTQNGADDFEYIHIPAVSRGETFGKIKIRLPENHTSTSEDDLRLYEAIAERLALALDNARLVEESQRRAAIERAISQMSSRISAVTSTDAILQTTVRELGQLVNDSEIIIQIGKTTTPKA